MLLINYCLCTVVPYSVNLPCQHAVLPRLLSEARESRSFSHGHCPLGTKTLICGGEDITSRPGHEKTDKPRRMVGEMTEGDAGIRRRGSVCYVRSKEDGTVVGGGSNPRLDSRDNLRTILRGNHREGDVPPRIGKAALFYTNVIKVRSIRDRMAHLLQADVLLPSPPWPPFSPSPMRSSPTSPSISLLFPSTLFPTLFFPSVTPASLCTSDCPRPQIPRYMRAYVVSSSILLPSAAKPLPPRLKTTLTISNTVAS